MKMILNKKEFYFLGSYISFFIFLISASKNLEIVGIFFKIAALCMFCLYLFEGNSLHKIDFEKTVLLLFGVILGFLMLIRGKIQGEYTIPNIMCVFIMLMVAVIYFVQNHNEIHFKEWIEENAIVLLIILTFAILSLEVINIWFMWDDRTYYAYPGSNNDVQGMLYNFNANFADVDGLYLAGHVSLGYSLWLILFQLIKEGSASVQVADIVLAGISIWAYYQILKKILANKISNKILALAVIPYAFSPFVLGMVGNLNLDSATMHFMVIFIACSLYQYEILEWTMAFFFCFTKETAIIYYIVYIIVKVLCEYLAEHQFHLGSLIKCSFGNIRNYIYTLPVILWGVLKMLKPIWGGKSLWSSDGINCFGIDKCVIAMKLKQMFLLNFNWFFWGSIAIGVAILVIKKNKLDKAVLTKVFPICSIGIIVIAFGCLYITYTNVRYNLPLIPVLYLTATIIIANLGKESVFCVVNFMVSILLLIQNYYVIDPIMNNAFDTIMVGNGKVYSMQVSGSQRVVTVRTFKDSIVYNRQYIYYQETLIDTLRKAGYDGKMLVVLPESYNCTEFSLLGEKSGVVLWNIQKDNLEYYNENIDIPDYCTWMNVCHTGDVNQAFDGNDILYIVPRWADIDMDFISNKKLIRQGEVDNKGFNIQYMVMTIENNLPLPDDSYIVSPKQDDTLGLSTEGGKGEKAFLGEGARPLSLVAINAITYHFVFEEYQVALDVPAARIDNNGTVEVWPINNTNAQKWVLEEVDGYYMICFKNYALTYNLDDKTVKLTPKTGEDNQLWLFTK